MSSNYWEDKSNWLSDSLNQRLMELENYNNLSFDVSYEPPFLTTAIPYHSIFQTREQVLKKVYDFLDNLPKGADDTLTFNVAYIKQLAPVHSSINSFSLLPIAFCTTQLTVVLKEDYNSLTLDGDKAIAFATKQGYDYTRLVPYNERFSDVATKKALKPL